MTMWSTRWIISVAVAGLATCADAEPAAKPSLRGSLPAVATDPRSEAALADGAQREAAQPEENATEPSAEDMWVHVGHTGVRVGRGHIGHTGVTWGNPVTGYHHIGHTGASWGRRGVFGPRYGHVGHTGATWGRRGVFGPRYGHVGHTGATWGRRPWMLEVLNETSGIDGSNMTDEELWGHIGHTSATWGRRGFFGPRFGHIGHTGATWGRPWMLDVLNETSGIDGSNMTDEELWDMLDETSGSDDSSETDKLETNTGAV